MQDIHNTIKLKQVPILSKINGPIFRAKALKKGGDRL